MMQDDAAPAALAGPVIFSGPATGYGLMHVINPAARAAHEGPGSAMAQRAIDSYGQIKALSFGNEEAAARAANAVTGARLGGRSGIHPPRALE